MNEQQLHQSTTVRSPSNLSLNHNNSFASTSYQEYPNNNKHPSSNPASLTRNIPANTSFKDQKKSYNLKKRCFTKNIQSAIDSTQEAHSGWLKARTTFKRWTKVWCQVKPGYLIIYTSQEAQKKHRLGVVLLSVCQVINRPTKKEGFCFKLINPFGYSVWAKSSTRALAFSHTSLTLRASDSPIGKIWLDALHQCNLSSNLDGYQPVVEDALEMIEGSPYNRFEISDDSDDGEHSTRHMDSILLNHGNSSNNNSALYYSRNGAGKAYTNANSNHSRHPTSGSQRSSQSSLMQRVAGENASLHNGTGRPSSRSGRNTSDCAPNTYVSKINDAFRNNKTDYETSTRDNGLSANSTKMVAKFCKYNWKELQLESVTYVGDETEELGSAGVQSEEIHESNKNFLWHIIKQLRPGMDLSKVTLPTFILEPRSFLEKLADYYYHCDILSDAVLIDDPVIRLTNIVKWYLSGFYKKPKGPKKPYNPILGERFRCFWEHPKTQSRTFFVAEQVSHHPPISAFHVSNRKDGYTISCALLSRSKFGGNSVSAILDGRAKLYLSKRNETYTLTMPYANCRGILLGSLCLELGGKVEIECAETGCKCELDFKLAPVWASSNSYNALTGKILKDNKVTHTLEGQWDKRINIIDKSTNEKSVLWEVTDAVRNARLKRYTVAMKDQGERESVKLWSKVTEALQASDQTLATAEKTKLEDMQRQEARERTGTFSPQHFTLVPRTNEWSYRWQDDRCWNERRDIMQFEENFRIRTLMYGPSGKSSSDRQDIDPIIDLPLSQMSKLTGQLEGVEEEVAGHRQGSDRGLKSIANPNSLLNTYDSIETRIDNENMLIKAAIKEVSEKNRELEEDLATLKRGKKTFALVMAAFIVALLGAFFKYFS